MKERLQDRAHQAGREQGRAESAALITGLRAQISALESELSRRAMATSPSEQLISETFQLAAEAISADREEKAPLHAVCRCTSICGVRRPRCAMHALCGEAGVFRRPRQCVRVEASVATALGDEKDRTIRALRRALKCMAQERDKEMRCRQHWEGVAAGLWRQQEDYIQE